MRYEVFAGGTALHPNEAAFIMRDRRILRTSIRAMRADSLGDEYSPCGNHPSATVEVAAIHRK